MKKLSIWAGVFASSIFLISCSVFKAESDPASGDASAVKETPPVTTSVAKPVTKSKAPPTTQSDNKVQRVVVTSPETPSEYFEEWIKTPANKTTLQTWLNKKASAPKDIDTFLTGKRYKDLRYEAYADLVGSK